MNATDIRADQVQDYEEALTLQRRMAMDAKNASCNNNNNDIDGVEVNCSPCTCLLVCSFCLYPFAYFEKTGNNEAKWFDKYR